MEPLEKLKGLHNDTSSFVYSFSDVGDHSEFGQEVFFHRWKGGKKKTVTTKIYMRILGKQLVIRK